MKKIYKYMHTLKGKPAFFCGYQIFYASQYVEKLCDSLKEIREERQNSINWREKQGFSDSAKDYGYIKVVINQKGLRG